jgi:hypothetical protein
VSDFGGFLYIAQTEQEQAKRFAMYVPNFNDLLQPSKLQRLSDNCLVISDKFGKK